MVAPFRGWSLVGRPVPKSSIVVARAFDPRILDLARPPINMNAILCHFHDRKLRRVTFVFDSEDLFRKHRNGIQLGVGTEG